MDCGGTRAKSAQISRDMNGYGPRLHKQATLGHLQSLCRKLEEAVTQTLAEKKYFITECTCISASTFGETLA